MFLLTLQAKVTASLSWLLSKAYGQNLPDQFVDPFCEGSQVGTGT